MRTNIFPVTALAFSIACCTMFFGSSALAQTKVNLPQGVRPLPPTEVSMQERVTHLESMVKTLQTQLAADEKKLQEASDTAGQAKAGIGFINVGMSKTINDLKGTVAENMSAVNTQIASTNGKLEALSNKFATHTHTYAKTTFGWWSQQMHDLKMAAPTPTSGPN